MIECSNYRTNKKIYRSYTFAYKNPSYCRFCLHLCLKRYEKAADVLSWYFDAICSMKIVKSVVALAHMEKEKIHTWKLVGGSGNQGENSREEWVVSSLHLVVEKGMEKWRDKSRIEVGNERKKISVERDRRFSSLSSLSSSCCLPDAVFPGETNVHVYMHIYFRDEKTCACFDNGFVLFYFFRIFCTIYSYYLTINNRSVWSY